MPKTTIKKIEQLKFKYRKGQYISDTIGRKKIHDFTGNDETWMEMIEEGENTDGTSFITIKLNNLTMPTSDKTDEILNAGLPRRM